MLSNERVDRSVLWVVAYRRRLHSPATYSSTVVEARSEQEAARIALEADYIDDGPYDVRVSLLGNLQSGVVSRSTEVTVIPQDIAAGEDQ